MTCVKYHVASLSAFDFGLFRSPGPGLGNLMFPVARALMGRERHGGTFVMPTMRQIKLGPLIRNEQDKRMYGDLFPHRSMEDWKNHFLSRFCRQLTEDELQHADGKDLTVKYGGLKNYFHDLKEGQGFLAHWFRQKARRTGHSRAPFDIAIHVRFGDFSKLPVPGSGHSVRIPLDWYVGATTEAKRLLAGNARKTRIFTDARPEEIAPLLKAVDAEIDSGTNALDSMLNMSEARIVIASRSTFSMWAAFLGNVPALWDSDFELEPYFPDRPGLDMRVNLA